ncbi:hypothetical protein Tsubulata_023471 [Turnera subulata]|uniref:Uncharacterized protein n=1 Tax=Turnera subulata TaxID=218843 RepID=A0A9Q0FQT0_9ROSI|nr:hypothetical protein Tsubulata_023471 [Turnera subulata]
MRLYYRGAAFCKKMRGKLSNMPKKQNIRDHKRRLLTAKYELRRKLSSAFYKDPDLPSDMWDKHHYKLSCPIYEFFPISHIAFRGLASRGLA